MKTREGGRREKKDKRRWLHAGGVGRREKAEGRRREKAEGRRTEK
jgi:hypothetical protein